MKPSSRLKIPMVMAVLLAASSFAVAAMEKAEYLDAKTQISNNYTSDRAACEKNSGNEREICTEKAKGKQKVTKAELEYKFSGKASDGRRLAVVKADSTYSIAKEMCDSKTGTDEDICEKEAKTVHVKALADAKLNNRATDPYKAN